MVPLRVKIIELLVQKGVLNPRQVEEVLRLHKEKGIGILSLLFEKDYVKKDFLSEFINNNIRLPSISSVQVKITPEILALVSRETAKEQHVCPLSLYGNNLTVAVDNPMSIFPLAEIASLEKYNVSPVIAPEAELAQLIEHHYPQENTAAPVSKIPVEAHSDSTMEDILDNVKSCARQKNLRR